MLPSPPVHKLPVNHPPCHQRPGVPPRRAVRIAIRAVLAAVVALLITAAPDTASAQLLVGFGQFSIGSTEFSGDYADEFVRMPAKWQIGGGLRYRQVAVSAHAGFGPVTVHDEARHGRSPFSFWLGPELRYYTSKRKGFQPYLRGGLQRVWLSGTGPVTRWCDESRTCDAGFFSADPSYRGWATQFGVGVHFIATSKDGMYGGFWLDAGYDAIDMQVVERNPLGGMIRVTLGGTIGGGRTR